MTHVHLWRLLGSAPATDGVCACGEERAFNGGFTAQSVTFAGRKVARGGQRVSAPLGALSQAAEATGGVRGV